jgi:integrase
MEQATRKRNRTYRTQRDIEDLPVEPLRYDARDEKAPSLFIRVGPTGVKSFLFFYRVNGRQVCATLGRFGVITLDEARKMAKNYGGEATKGENPARRIITARNADTFKALAQRFLDTHGPEHLKPETLTTYRSIVTRLMLPKFGTMKVNDLDAPFVSKWHERLSGTPRQANQALAILSSMLTHAERWGMRKAGLGNPCKSIPRYEETVRDRALEDHEIYQTLAAMNQMAEEWIQCAPNKRSEKPKAHPGVLDLFRLLLLTGARIDELRMLTWNEVLLDANPPILKMARGKEIKRKRRGDTKEIALSQAAVEILQSQIRMLGVDYVFYNPATGKPWVGTRKIFMRVLELAGIEDLKPHDLRHSFGTVAGRLGISGPQIQAALNHAHPQTTARYVNLKAKTKADVAEQVAAIVTRKQA